MLSERLRQIRQEHGMTQKELAEVLGIDRTAYTYYETGKTTPSAEKLCKLSKVFNVTVGYLLGVEENHPERMRSSSHVRLSAPVDPISQLNKEERRLLMWFRLLSAEDKQAIMREIESCLED